MMLARPVGRSGVSEVIRPHLHAAASVRLSVIVSRNSDVTQAHHKQQQYHRQQPRSILRIFWTPQHFPFFFLSLSFTPLPSPFLPSYSLLSPVSDVIYVTKPTKSTQPCIPPGSLNRVPALIGWGKGGTSPLLGEAVCELLYTRYVTLRY